MRLELVPVGGRVLEIQRRFLLRRKPSKQHVKDVEVPLITGLSDDPQLLQQIVLVSGTQDVPRWGEDELQVLAKTGAIVVHYCLSVPKGLKDRVHLAKKDIKHIVRSMQSTTAYSND